MAEETLQVEVVCALPDRQRLVQLRVAQGTTLRAAVMLSGLAADFPDIDMTQAPLGIFGKQVKDPDIQTLNEGERVEIYRPLLTDPRELRRQRALKAAQKRGKKGQPGSDSS